MIFLAISRVAALFSILRPFRWLERIRRAVTSLVTRRIAPHIERVRRTETR
jgi:hypothetical protein